MMYTHAWITTWLLSVKCVMTFGFSSYQQLDILVYDDEQEDTGNSSLSCLFCYNGDSTNDCMTLKNISNIPKKMCKRKELYCKVRRLTKYDNLVTFDRYCDSHCDPGCRDAASYRECVSCCNDRPNCNVDNSVKSCQRLEMLHFFYFLTISLIKFL